LSFKPTITGAYFLEVSGLDENALGTYTLEARTADLANPAVLTYFWRTHHVLSDTQLTTDDGTVINTGANGLASLSSVLIESDGRLPLRVDRSVPATEGTETTSAVNLQDAVAILKMVAGMSAGSPTKPVSPYQALAADFNADGVISLPDAIGVLRHATGLPTSVTPRWSFVDESDPYTPQRANLNPGVVTARIADVEPTAVGHVGLVGILRGDVDGSWSAPVGATRLKAEYFDGLLSRLDARYPGGGFGLEQWGLYTD
jgi:hypothetical protein